MKTTAAQTIDMSAVLLCAYEIADMIKNSREVADYLHWKKELEEDADIQKWIRLLAEKKERFEECQRFGRYHPDYNEALNEVYRVQAKLDEFEAVRRYKEAEARLDELLYLVSKTIAHSVSDKIKVPGSDPGSSGRGGCCAGGGCSCGCV